MPLIVSFTFLFYFLFFSHLISHPDSKLQHLQVSNQDSITIFTTSLQSHSLCISHLTISYISVSHKICTTTQCKIHNTPSHDSQNKQKMRMHIYLTRTQELTTIYLKRIEAKWPRGGVNRPAHRI
jgi:hypothetical protein